MMVYVHSCYDDPRVPGYSDIHTCIDICCYQSGYGQLVWLPISVYSVEAGNIFKILIAIIG